MCADRWTVVLQCDECLDKAFSVEDVEAFLAAVKPRLKPKVQVVNDFPYC